MASGHKNVIKLDLARQKLLVKPNDPIPLFYPPPRRVMVTPIYDDYPYSKGRDDSPSSASYARHDSRGASASRHRHTKSHSQSRATYTDSEYEHPRAGRSASHGRYHASSSRDHRERDSRPRPEDRYSDEDDDSLDDRDQSHRYSSYYPPQGREHGYQQDPRRGSSSAARPHDRGYDSYPDDRAGNRDYPPSSSDSDDYEPQGQKYSGTRSRPAGTGPRPEDNQGHGGGPGYPQENGHGQGQYPAGGGGPNQQQHPSYSQGSGSAQGAHGGGGGFLQQAGGAILDYAMGQAQSQGYGQGHHSGGSQQQQHPSHSQGAHGGGGYLQQAGGAALDYAIGQAQSQGHGQGHYPGGGGSQQQQPSHSHGAHGGGGFLRNAAGAVLDYAAAQGPSQGQGKGHYPPGGGSGSQKQQHPSYSHGSGSHGGAPASQNAQSDYGGSSGGHNAMSQPRHHEYSAVTQAFMRYAQKQGFFEEMSRYMDVLPPARDFSYSKCSGRKKAVCIGINYVGQKDELKGCANDARNMRDFIINMYHFDPQDIVLITDERQHPTSLKPTRKEMFNAMSWLVKDAQPHDSLFFHYSGHGGQSPDASGKEADGMDEVIFPVDYDQTDDIIDDELHQALIPTLPPGCRLTAIFDSCHSGTVLDLPYLHSAHGRLRSMSHISKRAQEKGVADCADVISFSACKDDETSADTREGGVAVGAMSYAFINCLKDNPNQTYEELLQNLRHTLIPKYHQKAQISGTHPLDLNRQFTL